MKTSNVSPYLCLFLFYNNIQGFGTTSFGGPSSSQLLHVKLDYVTNEKCMKPTNNYSLGMITDTMMCADGNGDAW
jgi:hypothetical protein